MEMGVGKSAGTLEDQVLFNGTRVSQKQRKNNFLPSFLCYLAVVRVVVEVEPRRGAVVVRVVDEVADRVRSSHRSGWIRIRTERIDDDLLRTLDLCPAERTATAAFGILVRKRQQI